MIYNNDKQSTQDVKKFLRDNPVGKNPVKETYQERKGTPTAPQNRNLPIRGVR